VRPVHTSDSPGYLDQCYPAQTALGGGDPVAVTVEGSGSPLESVKVAVSLPSDPTYDIFGTQTGPDGTYVLVAAPVTYPGCASIRPVPLAAPPTGRGTSASVTTMSRSGAPRPR
jgi:hypothetical protein